MSQTQKKQPEKIYVLMSVVGQSRKIRGLTEDPEKAKEWRKKIGRLVISYELDTLIYIVHIGFEISGPHPVIKAEINFPLTVPYDTPRDKLYALASRRAYAAARKNRPMDEVISGIEIHGIT